MQKDFELEINGQAARFTARTAAGRHVEIYEAGASAPCVVLAEGGGLDRALDRLVDNEELISLAISQVVGHGLIERARETGRPVHEALAFVPNPR